METWPQRAAFRSAVSAYQDRLGVKQADVAEALGTTLGTLRGWLYNLTKRPGMENLQRAAALFGCSVTEFMDDPGATVAGQATAHLSEARRFIGGMMFKDVTAEELSDEDAQILYEDFLASKARLAAMKQRMQTSADYRKPGK